MMPALSSELRSVFEKEVVRARGIAEGAARAASTTLAVEQDRPYESLSEAQRELRRALRARARQLGEGDMAAGMPLLVEEIAYEQWHRMLFTRFLAENELLMHPEGVAVTLEECAELAQEEGAEDLWAVATRYASQMLPGIFRVDDPALQVRFAPEGRHKLEQSVSELPKTVFTSDDGLGWAYQFWQSKKKDEVNASERKIGGADIAPVTQLFTEDYMVKFLLHNTLGAWWAHRHADSLLNKTFEYLRFREDGTPAAGTFDGWPETAAEVTMMDPCGGSGHFVVAAFEMFTRMRMEEEGLSAAEAGNAVIRDNVHMLEIDLRCTQIAAFNLALAAWKSGGYRELPLPNIACSGISVTGSLEEWLALAGTDKALQHTASRLYEMFRHSPDIGSLINPAEVSADEPLFSVDFERTASLLNKALAREGSATNLEGQLFETVVKEATKAAELLARKYVFVATNVPYLKQIKHGEELKAFCKEKYPDSKIDLATVFVERCREFASYCGSYSMVTPHSWLSLVSFRKLRRKMLREQCWNHVSWLGPRAFETISGEVVNPILIIISNKRPVDDQFITGIDVASESSPSHKKKQLKISNLEVSTQLSQLSNPDYRVLLKAIGTGRLLQEYADAYAGLRTGDNARFGRYFWETPRLLSGWEYRNSTVRDTCLYGGRDQVLLWEDGSGDLADYQAELARKRYASGGWKQGWQAWGKNGVLVSQMGDLPCTLHTGEKYDNNTAVIVPKNPKHLEAIWAFCSSAEYSGAVRELDKALKVTNATLVKVPFDYKYWQSVVNEQYPDGLPKPWSNDPTQWLFDGNPVGALDPMHVAVARLLGYCWPENGDDGLAHLVDSDGVVCLPSVVGETLAAERVRAILAQAYGEEWSLATQRKLLEDVGFKWKGLDVWLRDGFFKQHCKLFKNRPFIWYIWDGRKDGFSALVNYHMLDHARLERLIYTYLGDWINTQRAEQEQGVAGADGRLVAALELKKKLELILEGEPPYDIYVRWKPLHEQPIGWNPDLNDGVRLNIRPFVKAGVLRSKFTVHWRKDRGKNPDGSERINDLHFTRAEKEEARQTQDI